jgi:hypothetical protein
MSANAGSVRCISDSSSSSGTSNDKYHAGDSHGSYSNDGDIHGS